MHTRNPFQVEVQITVAEATALLALLDRAERSGFALDEKEVQLLSAFRAETVTATNQQKVIYEKIYRGDELL